MITNREEVLENALKVFAKMNYERASQTEIARACGLSKAGLIYYYPLKLDLFVAVADRYVFGMQSAASKLSFAYGSLPGFGGAHDGRPRAPALRRRQPGGVQLQFPLFPSACPGAPPLSRCREEDRGIVQP